MAKSKVVKTSRLKRLFGLLGRHKLVTVLLFPLVLVVAIFVGDRIYDNYQDSQNRKQVFQLIDNVEALHGELERELGMSLEREKSCTQPQDLSSTPSTPTQCSVGIDSGIDVPIGKEIVLSFLETKKI